MSEEREPYGETRQERRARKLASKRERMQQHGASLRRTLADAVLNMARKRVARRARRGK